MVLLTKVDRDFDCIILLSALHIKSLKAAIAKSCE